MSKHNKLTVFGVVGMLLAALSAGAKDKTPARPVQTAVIENSGSTNTQGYKITVSYYGNKYGIVAVSPGGKSGRTGSDESELRRVRKLFSDIVVAGPLTALPVTHGMRSVSFGTSTTLTYKGQRSPDLTSARDPRAIALRDDVQTISRQMAVGGPRRPLMQPMPTPNH